MANTDLPRGFSPKGVLLRQNPYSVDASNGTAVFINDIVMAEADGACAPAAAGNDATIGSAMNYIAVSTATTTSNPLMISDHPDQLYVAQDDGAGSPSTAFLFSLFDHVAGTGSATTFLSGHEIGAASKEEATGAFVILDAVNREDNDPDSDNADWVCQLNAGEGLLTVAAGI